MLEALPQKYQDQGVINLDDLDVLRVIPFSAMGTPLELIRQFDSRPAYEKVVHELPSALYRPAA